MINIHTHKLDLDKNILEIYNKKIQENLPKSTFSSGIHPWYITKNKLKIDFDILQKDLIENTCLALGEIGLDKTANINFETQKEVLIKQLELNKEYNKPVIIHCVKAYQEIIEITKNYNFTFIIHGFNKKKELANQLLKKGFYLSFGKALLHKKELIEVFKNTPINRIFLETDNNQISLQKLYNKAAKIKNIPLETLILELQNNFNTVFI